MVWLWVRQRVSCKNTALYVNQRQKASCTIWLSFSPYIPTFCHGTLRYKDHTAFASTIKVAWPSLWALQFLIKMWPFWTNKKHPKNSQKDAMKKMLFGFAPKPSIASSTSWDNGKPKPHNKDQGFYNIIGNILSWKNPGTLKRIV